MTGGLFLMTIGGKMIQIDLFKNQIDVFSTNVIYSTPQNHPSPIPIVGMRSRRRAYSFPAVNGAEQTQLDTTTTGNYVCQKCL